MRASILLWSTASGIILGLFIDATLIAVSLLLGAALPAISTRLHHRWFSVAAAIVLVTVPVAFAILGFLEGQLKSV